MKLNPLALVILFATGLSLHAAQPLPVSTPAKEGIDPARLERVHDLVGGYVRDGKHAGAVTMVIRNGRIVGWQTWGSRNLDTGAPMEKDTLFRIYSMSKVLTSVAALQLFEQGKLQLDSPVTQWLPELKNVKVLTSGTADAPQLTAATNQITIRMLLNHTGGFTYDFFSGSPVNALYQKQDLWNSSSLDEFIGKVGKLPLMSQPGTEFHYSIGLDVLGVIIQRASGMTFEDYVAKNITGPLKMVDTGFDVPKEKMGRLATIHQHGPDGKLRTTEPIIGAYAEEGRGFPSGGGGMFSTIGDYARFAQALANGGELEGTRILGRKTVALALENSLTTTATPYNEFSQSDGWGLLGAVRLDVARSLEPSSVGMFYWSGAATTHFFADPKEHLVALVFCQHIPFDEHQLFTRFHTAVYQALE